MAMDHMTSDTVTSKSEDNVESKLCSSDETCTLLDESKGNHRNESAKQLGVESINDDCDMQTENTSTLENDSRQDNVITMEQPIVQNNPEFQSEDKHGNESLIEHQDVSMTSVQNDLVPDEITAGQKTRKPRTKGLLRKLQDQLEFYFGDSNLLKDRFLKQKISDHPESYVSVDVIASFNRMKSLSSDRNLIIQAINKSQLLELSSDEKWVRRSIPLPSLPEKEIDSRTIYVENLPAGIQHEKLKRLFKPFGTVTYVSLPRHKLSSAVKGFAFIEFSSSEEAEKAVQHFKSLDSTTKLSTDTENPPKCMPMVKNSSELPTPMEDNVFLESKKTSGTSPVLNIEKISGTSPANEKSKTDTPAGSITSAPVDQDVTSQPVTLKRPREEDETSDLQTEEQKDIPPEPKRLKENDDRAQQQYPISQDLISPADEIQEHAKDTLQQSQSSDNEKRCITAKRTRWDSEGQTEAPDESSSNLPRLDSTWSEFSAIEDEDDENDAKKKRKIRKHRKRRESVAQQLKDLHFRVISKLEWLEMKQLYKSMQKEQMRILKEEDKKSRQAKSGNVREDKKFITNCLVKVTCSGEQEVTGAMLKDVCSKYGNVAYVDFENGWKEGYVRYSESGSVDKLIDADEILGGVSFSSLPEEDERAYFLKTQAARKQHYMSRRKRKRTRGQDKIISKAIQRSQEEKPSVPCSSSSQVTHIRFP